MLTCRDARLSEAATWAEVPAPKPVEVEEVLENSEGVDTSRLSSMPIAFGETSTGKIIAVVFEEIDQDSVYPITAFEVEP